MNPPIRNIDDLQAEIARLKALTREQGLAIGQRFSSPGAIFSTLYSLFPKSQGGNVSDKLAGFFNQDMVKLISRFLIPFTLNRTLFKRSGFLVKTLVGIVSQKASHYITEENITHLWD